MSEQWRVVPGYADRYQVSDQGNVRSMPRIAQRAGHPFPVAGGPMTTYPDKNGYMQVRLSVDGVSRHVKVHQLVLLAFVGPRPPGMGALHHNDTPGDNWVGDLYWGTQADNMWDMCVRGRHHYQQRARRLRDMTPVVATCDDMDRPTTMETWI